LIDHGCSFLLFSVLPEAELHGSFRQFYFLSGNGGDIAFGFHHLPGFHAAASFDGVPAAGVTAEAAVDSGVKHPLFPVLLIPAKKDAGGVYVSLDLGKVPILFRFTQI
jgi:hypothetical protein